MTNKHRNKITFIDNIRFQSKLEAGVYIQLKLLQKAGKIQGLELQKPFIVHSFKIMKNGKLPNKMSHIVYKPDFYYIENGQEVVNDAKGTVLAEYRIKRALFVEKYPHIIFYETYSDRVERIN